MTPQYIKIDEDGNMFYFKDKAMNILHREDGPACEYASGTKAWYLNGVLHREDGPACEYAGGSKSWYLHGVRYTEEEFKKNIKDHNLKVFAMGVLNILANHEEWDSDVMDKIVDSSVDFGVANFTADGNFNVL
jgi:hypothetical protein